MSKVVKGNYINVTGDNVSIENKSPQKSFLEDGPENALELAHAKLNYEIMRFQKEKEDFQRNTQQVIDNALSDANVIIQRAKEEANRMTETVTEQSINMRRTAQTEGYSVGYDDGYKDAQDKVFERAEELKIIINEINASKDELFKRYEKQILETILEISEKVILQSLAKDTKIISRLIKQAAKSFRNSDYVKITVSETDVSDEFVTDIDYLRTLVGNVQHIEIETLKDAQPGTVIIDNDSEITDASVSTQLKMITELARGKYRKDNKEE